MRSRVMPGSSPTMERREPVRRLKRVDLPTLGRPQMAMRGKAVAGCRLLVGGWRDISEASCSARSQARSSAASVSGSGRPMLAELGVWRPTIPSAGEVRAAGFLGAGVRGAAGWALEDLGAMVRRDSFSGERVGVRRFFSCSARLAARVLRLRGSTAPVVGVTRGARPCLGRVDAWRCF